MSTNCLEVLYTNTKKVEKLERGIACYIFSKKSFSAGDKVIVSSDKPCNPKKVSVKVVDVKNASQPQHFSLLCRKV